MAGRDSFKKWRRLIGGAAYILGWLPEAVRIHGLECAAVFPGRIGVGLRYLLIRSISPRCGDNVYIGRFVTIKSVKTLHVGSNVSIHEYCYLDATGGIAVGDNTSIAHSSTVLSSEHAFERSDIPIKYQPLKLLPTSIGSGCWIGCGARILGGANISNGCVVGAGAVVKGSFKDGQILVGIPARSVRER